MKKKFIKIFTISGQALGMLIGTSLDNFYGLHSFGDFAFLFGVGIPFAFIGVIIGFSLDYFLKNQPNEDTHLKCPDCRELIFKDARKCKHCGCKLIPQ